MSEHNHTEVDIRRWAAQLKSRFRDLAEGGFDRGVYGGWSPAAEMLAETRGLSVLAQQYYEPDKARLGGQGSQG